MINNMSQGLGSFNNMMPQNNMMQQNPYGQQMGQQMNPQMGQQMRSPEMFSEQLMAPNQMNPVEDPMQGLQPMAEPEGFGVYGQSLEGFADGGAASSGGVPRETMIGGQPHMLAYINPEEEQMLYNAGGSGEPGPGGVPAFRTLGMSPGEAGARGGGYQGGDTVGSPTGGGYSDNNSPSELAYLANARAVQAMAAAERQAAQQAAANAAVVRQEQEMQAVQQAAAQQAAAQQAAAQQLSNQQMTGPSGGQGTGQGVGQGAGISSLTPTQQALRRGFDNSQKGISQIGSGVQVASNNLITTDADPTGTSSLLAPKARPASLELPSEKLAGYKKNTPNSFREYLANALTPGDNMEFVNGELVYGPDHKSAGQPVSPEERNSFNLKVGLGNSAGNDNPGESTYANYEEARAGNKSGLPGLPGAAASSLGGIMAFAGGIRGTDLAVGRGANGEQIFEAKNGTFYVIDRSTGLVRNVQGKNDSSNNQDDIARQQQSLDAMMADASSNNSPEELAYVAAIQAEQDAINNPVIASSYSPTALTRAGIGGGSNVGSFYDTTPNVVM